MIEQNLLPGQYLPIGENNTVLINKCNMTVEAIKFYITQKFNNINVIDVDGDLFFMHNGNDKMPFATIVVKDNEYDNVSKLDREGFFRLNIGVDTRTFMSMFEGVTEKKGIGAYLDSGIDFTKEDTLFPHPVYGSMYWVSVVNPSGEMFEVLKGYLDEAYGKLVKRE